MRRMMMIWGEQFLFGLYDSPKVIHSLNIIVYFKDWLVILTWGRWQNKNHCITAVLLEVFRKQLIRNQASGDRHVLWKERMNPHITFEIRKNSTNRNCICFGSLSLCLTGACDVRAQCNARVLRAFYCRLFHPVHNAAVDTIPKALSRSSATDIRNLHFIFDSDSYILNL